jgi:lysophospholipase L1-like esterase
MATRQRPKRKPLARFRKTTVERTAIAAGRKEAAVAVGLRASVYKKRERVVQAHYRSLRKGPLPKGRKATPFAAAAIPADVGVLVAEGDSWFDYPVYDVLKMLDDEFGYRVEAVSHRGDAVENMAYGGGQLDDFVRRLERVAREGKVPTAVLLSGGGNDVAGPEFAMLLEHKQSPFPGLNATVLDGVIDQRIRTAYLKILSRITGVCQQLWPTQPTIPILVHGYDYPVPDGRGFLGGWGPLPGPWLEPGFREKDYVVLPERIAIAATLIDRFNAMLESVVTMAPFKHVTYVNLRGTLSTNPKDYKKWWGNELHPTRGGFDAVTRRFVEALRKLPK